MHWASQEGPCLSLSLCLSKSLQPPPPHHACRASCCKFSILSSRRGLSSCIGLNLPLPQNWSIQMPNPNPVAFYQFDTTTCVTCTHSKNGFHEIWARRRSLSQAWLMWQGICSLRPSAELDRWLRGRVGRKQGAEEERSRRSLVCRSIWPPQPEPAFSFRAHKSSGGLLKRSFCTEREVRGKRMPLLVLRTTSNLLWEDKGKAVQLWKQEPRRRNSVFPDVPLLLERTQLYIKSRCFLALWAISQRHPEAALSTARHIWPPRPPVPSPPPLFSFHSFFFFSNCIHMWSVSTSHCQAYSLQFSSRFCFSPLSSALWYAGRFKSTLSRVPVWVLLRIKCSRHSVRVENMTLSHQIVNVQGD